MASQSYGYMGLLLISVVCCALEYNRWNFDGMLFYAFGILSICIVSLPDEVESKITSVINTFFEKQPKVTIEDSPVKIISQMNIELNDEDLQEDGLKALIILTDQIKSTEEFRKSIFQHGISPLIMRFIKDKDCSSHLKILALKLLKNLSTLVEVSM